MKLIYCILLACLFLIVQGDDFEIYFYGKPNYEDQVGMISGSVEKDGSAGTPRGNMVVRSFTCPEWLQVTVYEKHYWGGDSHAYSCPQVNIDPAVTVQSVKWKHL